MIMAQAAMSLDGGQYFCPVELTDDLFRCIPFLSHLLPPFYETITGIIGGQVNHANTGQ